MHSPYFPPTVPRSDASLPSTRSGRGPFPRFDGTIKALRLPAALLAALRCLRLAIPLGASWHSLPPPKIATAVGRGFFGFGDPPGPIDPVETTGSPKFLGNPNCFYARFFDSGRTARPHYHDGAAAWPPLEERRGLPHWDFRSSIAWP